MCPYALKILEDILKVGPQFPPYLRQDLLFDDAYSGLPGGSPASLMGVL